MCRAPAVLGRPGWRCPHPWSSLPPWTLFNFINWLLSHCLADVVVTRLWGGVAWAVLGGICIAGSPSVTLLPAPATCPALALLL